MIALLLPTTHARRVYRRTNPELLSINAAASSLSVSRWQVYQLINAGRLPTVQIGRRRLILRADLQALVRSLREASES